MKRRWNANRRRVISQLAVALAVLLAIVSVPKAIDTAFANNLSWIQPTNGQVVSEQVVLEVGAPASTAKVGFFVDGKWLAVDSSADPWSATLDTTTLSDGEHILKAAARDASDKVVGRSEIKIEVVNDPAAEYEETSPNVESGLTSATMDSSVSWVTPAKDTDISGFVSLEANGPVGTTKMSFFINGGTWLGADTNGAPWRASFDSTKFPNGSHTLKATARNSANTILGTSQITVTIKNGQSTSPTSPTPTPAPATTPTPSTDPAPAGTATIVRTVNGDDWHLPGSVTASPHSAIYGYGTVGDIMTTRTYMLSWADLHTGDNQFDWSELDAQLAKAPLVLRLKAGTPEHVPAFIRNRHNWKTFVGSDGEIELPQWSSGWADEWKPFITALGNRYRGNARLVGLQLGLTASGEPGMLKTDIASYESLGLTPTVLRDFLTRYHGDTLNAFQGAEWKVFTVAKPDFIGAYGGPFSKEQYAQAVRDGTLPLMQRGLGIRGSGMSEDYELSAAWPEWSKFANGMVVTNDSTFQPIVKSGHIDGQLENWYGDNKSSRVTTSDPAKLRYAMRLSLLRALADQYSFLWLDAQDIDFLGRDLPRYVQLTLGKRPSESPDALLVLGNFDGVKAWPRWLTPINLNATSDGKLVDTSGLGWVSGQDYLGRTITSDLQLAVDDRMMGPSSHADVEVVVTYLDTAGAWHLEYEGPSGVVSAPLVQGQGSGSWKSVTIALPNVVFAGGLSNGADLRLVTDKGPVTIQVVRVIR